MPTPERIERFRRRVARVRVGARAAELERRRERGTGRTTAKCFRCGRFKPRPSTVCDYCGDDPVTYNGSAFEFDRAHGWEW